MLFYFVHGWGFDGGVWRDIEACLSAENHQVKYADLGFLTGGPEGSLEIPEGAISVGHSLGFLWLLKQDLRKSKGIVSLAGFDCFHNFHGAGALRVMKADLKRDPWQQMVRFWVASGTDPYCLPEALNIAGLESGLDWLSQWDERERRAKLECPVMALAARDDKIVPEKMTEAIWSKEELHWRERGGHALPLTHPQWCAKKILDFCTRNI